MPNENQRMACCCIKDTIETDDDNIKIRGCTDVLFLFFFILFLLVMIFIAGFAFVYGNPLRLINGYDSFGNTCGSSTNEYIGTDLSGLDLYERRYLFYLDVTNIKISLQICVEKCPDHKMESMNDIVEFYERTHSSLCSYDIDLMNLTSSRYLNSKVESEQQMTALHSPLGPCPPVPIYKSAPVLNRCVPQAGQGVSEELVSRIYEQLNSWPLIQQVLSEVYKSWPKILGFTCLSLVLSLAVVSMLHYLSGTVAYLILSTVCVTYTLGTAIVWWSFYRLKLKLDRTPFYELLEESVHNEHALCIYGIVCIVITVILLLLVCAMRNRISSLDALFQESSACLSSLPSLFIQPIITLILLTLLFYVWMSVIVCLATSNYPGQTLVKPFSDLTLSPVAAYSGPLNSTPPVDSNATMASADLKKFTLVHYVDATWISYMWWVYVVGLIWIAEFLLACQHMVIAGAVARWYFDGGRDRSPEQSRQWFVWRAARTLLMYHLGSTALGALLITALKIPRLILFFTSKKLKERRHKCCGGVCVRCVSGGACFLRYMNHNAYTVVAFQGTSFCTGAERAWTVLASNTLNLAAINRVGDFVLFLAKCVVTGLTGSAALLALRDEAELAFFSAPLLLTCVFAFFASHCVVSLYEIVIDTLFLCISEDQYLNGNEGQWRSFAPVASAQRRVKNRNNKDAMVLSEVPELTPINAL